MEKKEQTPEWIIATYDDPNNRKVEFSELLALKDKISSALLLWDYNSYYVNLSEQYFIINGGRRLQPTIFPKLDNSSFLYARRNKKTMPVGVAPGNEYLSHEITYLLGIEGTLNGEKKELLIQISSDGSLWKWIPKR